MPSNQDLFDCAERLSEEGRLLWVLGRSLARATNDPDGLGSWAIKTYRELQALELRPARTTSAPPRPVRLPAQVAAGVPVIAWVASSSRQQEWTSVAVGVDINGNKLEQLYSKLEQSQNKQEKALSQIFDGFEKRTAEYWSSASVELSERFDHAPNVLSELQKVVASLEGARALGSELPKLSEKLGGTTEQLASTLTKLEQRNEESQTVLVSAVQDGHQQLLAGIDHWATQQREYQASLAQWGARLLTRSEQSLPETRVETGTTATTQRRVLGMPLGPPPWMVKLLNKFNKEGKP